MAQQPRRCLLSCRAAAGKDRSAARSRPQHRDSRATYKPLRRSKVSAGAQLTGGARP